MGKFILFLFLSLSAQADQPCTMSMSIEGLRAAEKIIAAVIECHPARLMAVSGCYHTTPQAFKEMTYVAEVMVEDTLTHQRALYYLFVQKGSLLKVIRRDMSGYDLREESLCRKVPING